jgi:hypothetical protein
MVDLILGFFRGLFRRNVPIVLSESDLVLRDFQIQASNRFRQLPSNYRPTHVYRDPISRTVLICVLGNFKTNKTANQYFASGMSSVHVPQSLNDGVKDPENPENRIYAVLRDVPYFLFKYAYLMTDEFDDLFESFEESNDLCFSGEFHECDGTLRFWVSKDNYRSSLCVFHTKKYGFPLKGYSEMSKEEYFQYANIMSIIGELFMKKSRNFHLTSNGEVSSHKSFPIGRVVIELKNSASVTVHTSGISWICTREKFLEIDDSSVFINTDEYYGNSSSMD